MSRVFWDTNVFIYLLDRDPLFYSNVVALRDVMRNRADTLITSAMTLAEVQVWPLRNNDASAARRYRAAIEQSALVLAFDSRTADTFASIRVDQAIKPQDAMQLSVAALAGVDLFVTNDRQLRKLVIPGIEDIVSIDEALMA